MKSTHTWVDFDQIMPKLFHLVSNCGGVDLDAVRPESRLIQDLNFDSLDVMELFSEIDNEFNISTPKWPTDEPVAKSIFTRSPLRVSDLAEYIFLYQGTGSSKDRKRRAVANAQETPEEAVFSQLGGCWSGEGYPFNSLYIELETDCSIRCFRRQSDGMICIQVPSAVVDIGGMGTTAEADELPRHQVKLSSFLMDIEPVSVVAFCRFLNSIDATRVELDSLVGLAPGDDRLIHMQFERLEDRWAPRQGLQKQPIVLISWFAANAYSLWAHGENWREYLWRDGYLPTEAQWEFAASEAYTDSSFIQAGIHTIGSTYADGLLPVANVQQRFGESEFGLRHMCGTVWHWCRDWYDPEFYRRPESLHVDPVNRAPTAVRSERGGSWVGPLELCRPSYRRGRDPHARGRCLGFRCARAIW